MTRFRCRLAALLATGLVPLAAHAASLELTLAQADGSPLSGAVVAAYALGSRSLPSPAPAVMDQRDRRFVPQILAVQTGARVAFANSDKVTHHVYSFSPAKRFQLYVTKGEVARSVVFDQPGVVTLGCNLHDWMLGYILVVDTPYFAQTDAQGHAALAPLPGGRYRLEVWHPRITDDPSTLRREIDLDAAARLAWPLSLSQALLPARDQQPGFANY